jgi:hypothetical protein
MGYLQRLTLSFPALEQQILPVAAESVAALGCGGWIAPFNARLLLFAVFENRSAATIEQ